MHLLFLLEASRNFLKWSNTLTLQLEKTPVGGEAAVMFLVGATSLGGIFYLKLNDALVKVEGSLQYLHQGKSCPLLVTFCVTTDKLYGFCSPVDKWRA